MTGRILVMGAAGRLGYVACEDFRDAGWTVVARPPKHKVDGGAHGYDNDAVEMRALFIALRDTLLPAHDVHGRSTIVQISWDELERRFGRR